MKTLVRIGVSLLMVASAVDTVSVAAQQSSGRAAAARQSRPRAVLTVPATGTFGLDGQFAGTISINRFERRSNDIIAIGVVAGVLSRGGQPVGTAVAAEVAWAVRVTSGGVSLVSGREPATGSVTRVAWSPGASPDATLRRVQADVCPVLNVSLGPNLVDLLGAQVALSGVTLDLQGVVGTALGDLVCEVSDLLGNVAAIVNLLNNILALLTGLLGGLTGGLGGGIGGIVPMP